jgi:hypothetical protein
VLLGAFIHSSLTVAFSFFKVLFHHNSLTALLSFFNMLFFHSSLTAAFFLNVG